MKLKLIACLSLVYFFSVASLADTLKLKANHPDTYTVVKGDTLWDISAHFLNTPWLWPRLWQANSQIANPHLIYPGDVLNLIWVDGQPQLTRKKLKKLSPTPRLSEKTKPIPTIPLTAISAFLSRDHIIDPALLSSAPKLLGDASGTPAFFEGDNFYGQGKYNKHILYGVYRLQGQYTDPDTQENLGSKLTFIGHAEVSKNPDFTATEQVTPLDFIDSKREARQGDLILPIPEYEKSPAFFLPQSVPHSMTGYILGSATASHVIGKWDTTIINRGKRDNISAGSMFSILQSGPEILLDKDDDAVTYRENGSLFDKIEPANFTLPAKRIGEVMVFKVYDKVSLALVMRGSELIKKGYTIQGIEF